MADDVAAALRAAAGRLAAVCDTPRLDAELLMAHALGVARSELLLRWQRGAPPASFAALLDRRLAHEPVAYIVGRQEFYGLDLRVTPAVLIPRADSETLVDAAIAACPDARRILDCGTGSGALLLAVLSALPLARGIGIDRSEAALVVARDNAAQLRLEGRATMVQTDWDVAGWEAQCDGPFDLILANPPYVEDAAPLDPAVRDYEPPAALFAGPDGLAAHRALIPRLRSVLDPSGFAIVEIGATQAAAVSAIALSAGLRSCVRHDLGDRPRALEMSWMR